MGEGLDDSLRRRVEIVSKKNEAKDSEREMVWVKKAVRWCVYDIVRSLRLSRGNVGWGLMTG